MTEVGKIEAIDEATQKTFRAAGEMIQRLDARIAKLEDHFKVLGKNQLRLFDILKQMENLKVEGEECPTPNEN